MSKWMVIILWTCVGFLTACTSLLSAIHLYYYFNPPISSGTPKDYLVNSSTMMTLGPITLWNAQIPIVFGTVFLCSLGIVIFSIRQCMKQSEHHITEAE